MTRRPARPSGRVAAVVTGLAVALVVGGAVVLIGHPSPEEGAGPESLPASSAGVATGVSPSAPAAGEGPAEVVAVDERRVRRAVPLHAVAHFDRALSLQVVEVEPVRGVARGPGEIAGPAVRFTVRLANAGDRPLSLESVVLAVSYGRAETPAVTLTGPGGHPFGGTLGAGRSQTATYVVAIPQAARGRVQVIASHTGTAPAVRLVGSVP